MIKVFLADDHAVVRQGLKMIFKQILDIEVSGESSDGSETIEKLAEVDTDVLLLDLDMPKMNGFSVVNEIKTKYKTLKILILTMHPEEVYGLNALSFGAHGFVSKNTDSKYLIEAVRTVHEKGVYMSNNLAQKVALGQVRNELKYPPQLSSREMQVLKLIGTGKRNKDIAVELDINEKTISTYKKRLMKKLHIDNIADLINYSKNV